MSKLSEKFGIMTKQGARQIMTMKNKNLKAKAKSLKIQEKLKNTKWKEEA